MSFFDELKRRNVFRVGIAYAISAWVLLQIADLVLDNIVAPDWVMHVLMLLVGLGFIVALVIAWAYEMTPEGIKREADVDRSGSVTHHTAKKLDVITLVAVGALAILIIGDRFVGTEKAEKGSEPFSQVGGQTEEPGEQKRSLTPDLPAIDEKSIAVLPLANRSINPEDAFFAEGMHDEILTRLSRIGSLKVISRTSVMGYANTTKKMAEIGQELGVATLLEGGVQRAGNRVRVNVQLIEAATDKHLWAEIFDRELSADNLFDIQSEITRSISDALQAVLTGDEQLALSNKPTENLEAYAYYLRGKALAAGYGRSQPQIKKSIEIYQAALDLDPQFAEAWAAIAIDWTELHWVGSSVAGELSEAAKALKKAQALAGGSAETLIAEGYLHYWGHLEYEKALTAFNTALEKKPGSVLALRGKAYALRRMGDLDQCTSIMRRAIELDPNDPGMPADLAYTLLRTGKMQEAKLFFERAITQGPEVPWNRWSYSYYFQMMNDLDGLINFLGPLGEEAQDFVHAERYKLARYQNDLPAMERVMADWKANETVERTADLAFLLAEFANGRIDEHRDALRSLEQAFLEAESKATRQETALGQLILVHGLMGDQKRLESSIHRFETELKPDALRIIEVPSPLYAWTMLGDKDKALDYAEKTVSEFGPWEFFLMVQDPIFDSLRGEPRYKQMALDYDRWLESVQ